jgi:uncharacterized membrane protein YhfC
MKKMHLAAAFLLLISMGLSACAPQAREESNYKKGSYLTGRTLNESTAAEQDTGLTITVTADGEPTGIMLRGILTQGSLFVSLKDQSGVIAWSSTPVSGNFNQNMLVNTLKTGTYHLFLAWGGPAQGQMDILTLAGEGLRIPEVSPLGLTAGGGMLLVALGYFFFAARRRLGWKYIGLGALAWTVAVIVKLVFSFLFNSLIYKTLVGSGSPISLPGLVFDVYFGSLTGLFEVLLVWLFVRSRAVDKSSWKKALAFGIGFGAFEAILLGIGSLSGVSYSLLNSSAMPLSALESLSQTANLLYDLAPISERFFTILVHIFSSLLIFYAAVQHKQRWMWLAFVYKTLFDSVAAYAQLTGILYSLGNLWLVELVIIVFGVAGWFGIQYLCRRYPSPQPAPAQEPSPN